MAETNQAPAEAGAAAPLQEYTHTLKHPITVKTPQGAAVDTITSIVMRRPKAKHMREMDKGKGEMGKVLELVRATSGLPASVVDEIDGEDVIALAEAIADFFGVSLPTG